MRVMQVIQVMQVMQVMHVMQVMQVMQLVQVKQVMQDMQDMQGIQCLARYSLRATTPKTNRAPNEPARPVCAQESIFWAKFGLFGTKNPYMSLFADIWP